MLFPNLSKRIIIPLNKRIIFIHKHDWTRNTINEYLEYINSFLHRNQILVCDLAVKYYRQFMLGYFIDQRSIAMCDKLNSTKVRLTVKRVRIDQIVSGINYKIRRIRMWAKSVKQSNGLNFHLKISPPYFGRCFPQIINLIIKRERLPQPGSVFNVPNLQIRNISYPKLIFDLSILMRSLPKQQQGSSGKNNRKYCHNYLCPLEIGFTSFAFIFFVVCAFYGLGMYLFIKSYYILANGNSGRKRTISFLGHIVGGIVVWFIAFKIAEIAYFKDN